MKSKGKKNIKNSIDCYVNSVSRMLRESNPGKPDKEIIENTKSPLFNENFCEYVSDMIYKIKYQDSILEQLCQENRKG